MKRYYNDIHEQFLVVQKSKFASNCCFKICYPRAGVEVLQNLTNTIRVSRSIRINGKHLLCSSCFKLSVKSVKQAGM